jgi:DNA-binding MarR family transcriptional regulator
LLGWHRAQFIKAAWDKAKRYNHFGLRAPNKFLTRAIKQRKLTEKQALKILSLKGKMRITDIAKKFKVTSGCISAILSGKNFKHLHIKVIHNEPIKF